MFGSQDLFEIGEVFNGYTVTERFERDGPIQEYLLQGADEKQYRLQCMEVRPLENTPERIARFHEVSSRLKELRHDIFPRSYEAGISERIYWAITAYERAPSLMSALAGMKEDDVRGIACLANIKRIAVALQFANERGLLHLRLDPSRILLNQRGYVARILDLGIAEMFSIPPKVMRAAPYYAAPEQLRDAGAPGARADIYALGMIFYQMIILKHPFEGSSGVLPSLDDLLSLAMFEVPPLIRAAKPAFPEFLDVFIRRTIAKLPDDRPLSWVHFLRELNEISKRYIVWDSSLMWIKEHLNPQQRRALELAFSRDWSRRASKKPQSGVRPAEAVVAGLQGYEVTDRKAGELEHGIPEPDWMSRSSGERSDVASGEGGTSGGASEEDGTSSDVSEEGRPDEDASRALLIEALTIAAAKAPDKPAIQEALVAAQNGAPIADVLKAMSEISRDLDACAEEEEELDAAPSSDPEEPRSPDTLPSVQIARAGEPSPAAAPSPRQEEDELQIAAIPSEAAQEPALAAAVIVPAEAAREPALTAAVIIPAEAQEPLLTKAGERERGVLPEVSNTKSGRLAAIAAAFFSGALVASLASPLLRASVAHLGPMPVPVFYVVAAAPPAPSAPIEASPPERKDAEEDAARPPPASRRPHSAQKIPPEPGRPPADKNARYRPCKNGLVCPGALAPKAERKAP